LIDRREKENRIHFHSLIKSQRRMLEKSKREREREREMRKNIEIYRDDDERESE
jgi:hypothetical protein